MTPAIPDWSSDRRLDILLLGPMGDKDVNSNELDILKEAVDALLVETGYQDVLKASGIKFFNTVVPNRMTGNDIISAVLEELDIADLVIFDLNPKSGQTLASPNVFYELALVHSLGIPYLILARKEVEIPFYASGATRTHFVNAWDVASICAGLRAPFLDFLSPAGTGADISINPVSKFYRGIHLVDISAAMGLATGYYYNFIRRLILDDGLITQHPEKLKQIIIVRPSNLESTFNRDMETLEKTLTASGITWKADDFIGTRTKDLGDKMRGIAFNHANGIVFDIPSTIYPLQHSPRLQVQRDKLDSLSAKPLALHKRKQRHLQAGDALLNQIEHAIRHHLRRDGNLVRISILHFSNIADLPLLIQSLALNESKR